MSRSNTIEGSMSSGLKQTFWTSSTLTFDSCNSWFKLTSLCSSTSVRPTKYQHSNRWSTYKWRHHWTPDGRGVAPYMLALWWELKCSEMSKSAKWSMQLVTQTTSGKSDDGGTVDWRLGQLFWNSENMNLWECWSKTISQAGSLSSHPINNIKTLKG